MTFFNLIIGLRKFKKNKAIIKKFIITKTNMNENKLMETIAISIWKTALYCKC